MDNKEMNITVRQLRSLLFNIDNQDMTVAELRSALYDVDAQEAEIINDFMAFKRLGIEME